MELSEHQIQKQIVEYLLLKNISLFETDVMSGLQFFSHTDKRRFGFINHHKKMGYRKGQADLIIVLPVRTLFIEVKTLKGIQSKEQKEFEKEVKELGHEYLLWRSVDEAISWQEAYANKLF